jgi:regulatory protein YycH of two-component signal transduction system YycFG
MNFAVAPSAQGISEVLLHALVILSLTLAPWLIWRLQKAHSLSK